MTEGKDWDRLAALVVAARVARGMRNREQLAAVSGFSARVLGDIEKARRENYDPETLAGLEHALGWLPGSVEAILAGGEPTRASSGYDQGTPDEDEFADLELEVRMILEFDMPEADKQTLIAEAWRLRERQLRDRRLLEERQATERRRLIGTWMRRAQHTNGNEQPAT